VSPFKEVLADLRVRDLRDGYGDRHDEKKNEREKERDQLEADPG
jgi:hypothetical protein